MHIAFYGLGNMGLPMATLLALAGHDVYGFDVSSDAVARFTDTSATAHALHREDVENVDVVITMLPNSAIVESVLLGDGTAALCRPNTLVVDMSSSEPLRSRSLAEELRRMGLRFVDAPVSGGVKGATEGRLAIMTGGAEADLAEVQPLFDVIGRSTVHVGSVGAGHAAKALNNLVSAASVAITVEALHVAERFGIDPDRFVEVLNASSGRSNTSENKARQFMLNGTYGSGFPIGLMTKDVNIALSLAADLDVAAPLSTDIAQAWNQVCEEGHAGEDHTRMYEYL